MYSQSQYKPLKTHEHLFLLLLFGGLFLYFLVGAIQGQIFIPAKYSSGGAYIMGLEAWLCLLTPTLLYLAILVRHGEIMGELNTKARTILEFIFLIGGIAILLCVKKHRIG